MQVSFLCLLSFFLIHPGDCQTHIKNRLTPQKAHTAQSSHALEEAPADNAVQQLKNHLKRLRHRGSAFERGDSLDALGYQTRLAVMLHRSQKALLTGSSPKPYELNCILLI